MGRIRDFFRQPHTRAKGRVGEDRAVAWLRRKGYRIVGRNVANAGGELDVVAREGDTLCFVEIRARSNPRFGGAVATVDREKRRRLTKAARAYLTRHPWEGPCRFDVVAVDVSEDGQEITLYRNAFQAGE